MNTITPHQPLTTNHQPAAQSSYDTRILLRTRGALAVALIAAALMHQRGSFAAQQGAAEVTFRIIIVSTEQAAQRLADQIARGASFASLAASESIDPSAGQG